MILLSMRKKLLVLLVSVFLLTQTLFSPVLANAQQWWAPSYSEFTDKVQNPAIPANEIFGERYTHAQVWWIIYSLMSFAIEHNVSECITINPDSLDGFINCVNSTDASSTNNIQSTKSLGFLEFARLSDDMIKIRPASGINYVASALDKLGVPSAYAQEGGFGFNTLSPILGLWQASRNAAYSLVTLSVIVLAFMIMFRTKISPQASVTVQSAIPRIIIGLILITFSYAIAGFIIDLSYILIGIIAAVVSQSRIASTDPINIFNLINDIGGGILQFGLAVVWIVFRNQYSSIVTALLGTGFVAGVLVLIISLILIVIAFVRIFWTFLKTYVMIIFQVIALPFAALLYIASPSGGVFFGLLRSLVGNVSVFVSVAVSVMFAHILLFSMTSGGGILSTVTIGNIYGVAPATGSSSIQLPGFGGADPSTLGIFVGIVVLLMGPSIANNIKSLIITGRPAREGFSMMGAGLAAAVGGFAGASLRQGAMSEIGYRLGNYGLRLQGSRSPMISGIGRGLTSFGQQYAQPYGSRETGDIRSFKRKGDKTGIYGN